MIRLRSVIAPSFARLKDLITDPRHRSEEARTVAGHGIDRRAQLWKHASVTTGGFGGRCNIGVPMAGRIASHLAVWLVVAVPLGVVLSKGWVATGDDAAIAIRSHQVLGLHPPLVGLASTAAAGSGQHLYDPGPLMFWLLAIPVRIDPTHGSLWGAALLGGIPLSVAIEAAWSTRAWLGCLLIAFAAANYLWLAPVVFESDLECLLPYSVPDRHDGARLGRRIGFVRLVAGACHCRIGGRSDSTGLHHPVNGVGYECAAGRIGDARPSATAPLAGVWTAGGGCLLGCAADSEFRT